VRKYILIIGALFILFGAGITCSATSDSTGDVWHYKQSGTEWTWEKFTGEKPNIDITDISYTTSGEQTIVTLTVAGSIVDSQNVIYYIYLVSDSASSYAYYSNGVESVLNADPISYETNTGSKAGSNSWSVTFNITASGNSYSIYGYSLEYTDISQTTNVEHWGDWAPDTYFPAYDLYYGGGTGDAGDEGTGGNETGGDTTGDETSGGTPGFELIFAIFAIAIALIFIKRKR